MSTHTVYTAHTPHLTLFYKEAKTYNLFSHILTPHSTAPYKKAKTYNLFSIVVCSCVEHKTYMKKKMGKSPGENRKPSKAPTRDRRLVPLEPLPSAFFRKSEVAPQRCYYFFELMRCYYSLQHRAYTDTLLH